MVEFKKELLTDDSLVVGVETEEESAALRVWAYANGKTWSNGESFLNKKGHPIPTEICICEGKYGCGAEYTVLTYEEALATPDQAATTPELYPLDKIGLVEWHEPVMVMVDYEGPYRLLGIFINGGGLMADYWRDDDGGANCEDIENVKHYTPEPEPTTRDMTAQEIAMLPRGTAFVKDSEIVEYNPRITTRIDRSVMICGCGIGSFKGYTLPGETEIRPFTVESTNE